MTTESRLAGKVALVDAVDHLLNRGAVVTGDATISLGGVDLIYVGLQLVISSVETLQKAAEERSGRTAGGATLPAGSQQSTPNHLNPVASTSPATGALPVAKPVSRRNTSDPEDAPTTAAMQPAGEQTSDHSLLAQPTGERPEVGLARLVLTLVELLRQVLERQAMRRMDGATLTDDEIERMGQALMEIETKMVELREAFGLTEEDVNLDLGPLGQLL